MTVPDHLIDHIERGGGLAVTSLTGRVGLRLAGQADLLNVGTLAAAIAALPADTEVHFQLAGLDFIDVQNTRELVKLASPPAARRLILHCPPPALLQIIKLAWPETSAQFVIATARPAAACDHGAWPVAQPGHSRQN